MEIQMENCDRKLSTGARIVNNDRNLRVTGSENQETDGESQNNSQKHAAVERHHGQHQHVTQSRIHSEQNRRADPCRG